MLGSLLFQICFQSRNPGSSSKQNAHTFLLEWDVMSPGNLSQMDCCLFLIVWSAKTENTQNCINC